MVITISTEVGLPDQTSVLLSHISVDILRWIIQMNDLNRTGGDACAAPDMRFGTAYRPAPLDILLGDMGRAYIFAEFPSGISAVLLERSLSHLNFKNYFAADGSLGHQTQGVIGLSKCEMMGIDSRHYMIFLHNFCHFLQLCTVRTNK